MKISKADTYIVKENKKDFSDIKDKSKEMQEAIRILASKGIINGVGEGKFNPDGANIPKWAKSDVALATGENLVVKRYDDSFKPTGTMTRGDVAVILYRLFKKLW